MNQDDLHPCCTGDLTDRGLQHDGPTCPVHEGDLCFESPVEFAHWTAVYAAMITRLPKGEKMHTAAGKEADRAVWEMRARRMRGVNGDVQPLDRETRRAWSV